jgi:multidrug efflux pump subunit AcrB
VHDELTRTLPAGMTFDKYINQGAVIAGAVNLFQLKFLIAVAVVMLVSFFALGLRAGLIVGITVPLTLGMAFLLMQLRGISLDRMSLGALIIALGLLVDDAIIAIEMMLVKINDGWNRIEAAAHIWKATAAPMLSGTLIAVIGFFPIAFAQSGVGEYAGNIFWVLGFALLASWVVAVTFTPYLGVQLLGNSGKNSHSNTTPADEKNAHGLHSAQYETPTYRRLRGLIEACIVHRKKVVLATLGIFIISLLGLNFVVKKHFFPNSDRAEVLVTVFLPEGSSFASKTKKKLPQSPLTWVQARHDFFSASIKSRPTPPLPRLLPWQKAAKHVTQSLPTCNAVWIKGTFPKRVCACIDCNWAPRLSGQWAFEPSDRIRKS